MLFRSRAFHTLKGSGRMVRAEILGELAWSIENMFNRVLDQTITVSPNLLDITEYVISQLPMLIDDFRERRVASLPTQPLIDYATALASNKAVTSFSELNNSSVSQTEVDDDEEISIGLPVELAEDSSNNATASNATEEDLDAALVEIFIGEAESHLTEIQRFIDESKEVYFVNSLSDELQRSLHTLKGSADRKSVV